MEREGSAAIRASQVERDEEIQALETEGGKLIID